MNGSTKRGARHLATVLEQSVFGAVGNVVALHQAPVAQASVRTESARHECDTLDPQSAYAQRAGRRQHVANHVAVELHAAAIGEPHHVLERSGSHFGKTEVERTVALVGVFQ